MNSLRRLECPDTERWQSLFVGHFEVFLDGSKAPDKKFKDFRNHVLHVSDNYWGGPVKQANHWYERTVFHLKQESWKSAVYAAGVLSHYYMDPLMPLHTGQTEEEGVIHRPCEWSINKSFDDLIDLLERESDYPKITLNGGDDWLKTAVHQGAEAAHPLYDDFINHYNLKLGVKDPPAGLDATLRHHSAQLLGHASVGFARILERAIEEANARPPAESGHLIQRFFYGLTTPVSWTYKAIRSFLGGRKVAQIEREYRHRGKVIDSLPADEKVVRHLHATQVLNVDLEELDQREIKPVGMVDVKKRSTSTESETQFDGQPKHGDRSARGVRNEITNATDGRTPGKRSFGISSGQSSGKQNRRSVNFSSRASRPETTKHRLDLADPLEDAPSIGPKTAARFDAIGIHTVDDFLSADAEEMALLLDTNHIHPDDIEQWQTQARLNCQIPGIYGHDAQILAACGFTSAEEVAEAEPDLILSLVDEFKKTPESKFIIRDKSSDPDHEEVANWIQWSGQGRKLDAA